MPELPEVEAMRRMLAAALCGQRLRTIDVSWLPIVSNAMDGLKRLFGARCMKIHRRGKYLLFHFDNALTLVVHLRMEGKFFYNTKQILDQKHIHCRFEWEYGLLVYHDTRKFGRMMVIETPLLWTSHPLCQLGYEPFDDRLTPSFCINACRKRTIPIKILLLDQKMIAGIGNIYANEALFAARIDPTQPASSLNVNEWDRLLQAIRSILHHAIQLGGTSIRTFAVAHQKGRFQDVLCVHHRANKPCVICGVHICKQQLRGRGTYYCPNCQKRMKGCS